MPTTERTATMAKTKNDRYDYEDDSDEMDREIRWARMTDAEKALARAKAAEWGRNHPNAKSGYDRLDEGEKAAQWERMMDEEYPYGSFEDSAWACAQAIYKSQCAALRYSLASKYAAESRSRVNEIRVAWISGDEGEISDEEYNKRKRAVRKEVMRERRIARTTEKIKLRNDRDARFAYWMCQAEDRYLKKQLSNQAQKDWRSLQKNKNKSDASER